MAVAVVDAHAAHCRSEAFELAHRVAIASGLFRAAGCVVARIKVQHQPFAPKIVERARRAVLVWKRETRRGIAHLRQIPSYSKIFAPQERSDCECNDSE